MYRKDFPIFDAPLGNGQELIYLDSAATAQKPNAVIDAMREFYSATYSTVNRSTYYLESLATENYELARAKLADFINADATEIVFTSGATESLNLIADSFLNANLLLETSSWEAENLDLARFKLDAESKIIVTEAEHHADLVPWQQLCKKTGAKLYALPVDSDGVIKTDTVSLKLLHDAKIVALTHVSNVTGAITDVETIVKYARQHAKNAFIVLDACQSVPHIKLNVKKLDIDFAAFSLHKLYGPTGLGVLYAKHEVMKDMPPTKTGGSVIEYVGIDSATFRLAPQRFEAGTPNIEAIIGAIAAVDYINSVGFEYIMSHENDLLEHLLELKNIAQARILGTAAKQNRIGVVSFTLDDIHPHEIGQFLDSKGIAIRVGHHCAQPIHRHFGIPVSARASLGIYNNHDDIDKLLDAVKQVSAFFAQRTARGSGRT
ncbi:MAG: SufS family cysteine desulfurase [Bifidobacteriaceae bacterium]|nr:SufS family cysteine desulfurase [Bifidobacteriaceae bacterium]